MNADTEGQHLKEKFRVDLVGQQYNSSFQKVPFIEIIKLLLLRQDITMIAIWSSLPRCDIKLI